MFKEDLKLGEKKEKELLELLKRKDPESYRVNDHFKGYDIDSPNLSLTFEVKYDRKYQETGNFFIETSCNGEPSGIEATHSDRFVIATDNGFHVYGSYELKNFLFGRRIVSGGDGNRVRGYLVKPQELSPIEIIYINLHKD